MLDIKQWRTQTQYIAAQLKKRGFNFDVGKFNGLEAKRKSLQVKTEHLQNLRNGQSKRVGQLKQQQKDSSKIVAEVVKISQALAESKKILTATQAQLEELFLSAPNIAHSSVPIGDSENDNVEIARFGNIPQFDFKVKDHVVLGELHGLLDMQTAAKISAARFALMYGNLAKLQRALISFMLDFHSKKGYVETYVPYLVNEKSLYGTAQLPKFAADLFKIASDTQAAETTQKAWYLIPTAEVPLSNIGRDVVIAEADLPKKYVAHTPCFRSEAGAYGRDTRGLIRQHQFEKVELLQMVKAEESYQVLEQLTGDAEDVLQALVLPYRKVILCSGDLGFAAAKTYDLEVWLPSQKTYREISSCSNFESFQARRLKARYKVQKTKRTIFVHTLNGSGLAVGRTLVAIMENYQQEDGNIAIPKVLQPYLGGMQYLNESQ